ncbi:MAG: hypothetical protein RIC35_20720 [Marinoscillum sp.]
MNEVSEKDQQPCTIAGVSHRFFTPAMAKETADNAKKEFAAKEYETKQVLDEIKEAAEHGQYSLETYHDENIAKNLRLIGYDVSDGYKESGRYGDHYMTVSWQNGG